MFQKWWLITSDPMIDVYWNNCHIASISKCRRIHISYKLKKIISIDIGIWYFHEMRYTLGHLRKNELHRCCQIFFLMMLSHCFTRHFTVLDLKTITYQKKPTTRHFCALEISSIRIILKNQSPQFISCNIFLRFTNRI